MKNAEQIDDEIRKELCNEYGIKNDRLINCQIHHKTTLLAMYTQTAINFEQQTKNITNKILNHIGIPLLGNLFDQMEVAEEEIKKFRPCA